MAAGGGAYKAYLLNHKIILIQLVYYNCIGSCQHSATARGHASSFRLAMVRCPSFVFSDNFIRPSSIIEPNAGPIVTGGILCLFNCFITLQLSRCGSSIKVGQLYFLMSGQVPSGRFAVLQERPKLIWTKEFRSQCSW